MPIVEVQSLAHLNAADRVIAFLDVVDSVRLMQRHERLAVELISRFVFQVASEIVAAHGGNVVEKRGDGLLLEFDSPRSAAACALALHVESQRPTWNLSETDRIDLRIGIHRADVFDAYASMLGHGVNIASRITALALPGQTVMSDSIAGQLVDGLDGRLEDLGDFERRRLNGLQARLEDLGDYYLKNVLGAVHLYGLSPTNSSSKPRIHSRESLNITLLSGRDDVCFEAIPHDEKQ